MSDPTLANVFEDASGIRREGGFLRRMSQIEYIHEGERVPDGYGLAWVLYDRAEMVCAPMPWHLLLGWGFRTYWRLRTGFGAGATGVIEQAVLRGITSGRAQARLHEDFLEREHKKEIDRVRQSAYQQGARDQLNVLLQLQGEVSAIRRELGIIDAAEKNH